MFQDTPAVFECKINGTFSTWRVNGQPISNNFTAKQSYGIDCVCTVKNLTIIAEPEYNESTVQCLSLLLSGAANYSNNATLIIQGNKM